MCFGKYIDIVNVSMRFCVMKHGRQTPHALALEHHQKATYFIFRVEVEQPHQDLLLAARRRVKFRPVDQKSIESRKS